MNPVPIAWGVTAPDPSTLQTGDLLFPRRGALTTPAQPAPQAVPGPQAGQTRLQDFLGARIAHLAQDGAVPPDAAAPTAPPAGTAPAPDGSPRDALDPSDPEHLYLMLRILSATFGDLTDKWLHMSVDRFVRHPLFQLLLGAMRHDLGGGFFVGHSAMVLREAAGRHADEGRLFVIEANTTDFSRYRVSLHPYHAPLDPAPAVAANAELMSGWVNYRAALGQKVWAARPKALADSANTHIAGDARQRILECAKGLLGRPYGFFDSPTLGDTDRLYCSEFVHTVFTQASDARTDLAVDDCRTWDWLLRNLEPASLRGQLEADLRADGLYERVIDEPFFLLTVQMLWRSSRLQYFPYPWGEGGYG